MPAGISLIDSLIIVILLIILIEVGRRGYFYSIDRSAFSSSISVLEKKLNEKQEELRNFQERDEDKIYQMQRLINCYQFALNRAKLKQFMFG